MNKDDLVELIGPTNVDFSIEEWLVSEPVLIPFFDDTKMVFTIEDYDSIPTDKAHLAIQSFLKLGSDYRLKCSNMVYGNFKYLCDIASCEELDAIEKKIKRPSDIWNFVQPWDIHVGQYSDDGPVYIQVCCNCDWEEEHGLQLVFKDGKALTRVSEQDGHFED